MKCRRRRRKKNTPFIVTKGERGQGMNWETGIDRHIACVFSCFSLLRSRRVEQDWQGCVKIRSLVLLMLEILLRHPK